MFSLGQAPKSTSATTTTTTTTTSVSDSPSAGCLMETAVSNISNDNSSSNSRNDEVSNLKPEDIHEHPNITNRRRIFTSAAAGATAGAVAKTVIAPLDRTKIYFQTHPDKNYRLQGAVKFLSKTYRQDGVLSLWRGNSATMARIVPYAGIQFMAHEQYKRMFGLTHKDRRTRPNWRNLVSGSMAGLTGQFLTYPLDRARAVMAVTKVGQYRNLRHVFKDIISKEGLMALYVGISPSMLGVVVYAGTSFYTFESLKYLLSQRSDTGEDPGGAEKFLCGALAGMIGQTISYPLDIVRRRMQTARQMGLGASRYPTILATLLLVLRREGFFKGLFKGLSMNFIKGPITTGISFATFDFFQLTFRKILLVSDDC